MYLWPGYFDHIFLILFICLLLSVVDNAALAYSVGIYSHEPSSLFHHIDLKMFL